MNTPEEEEEENILPPSASSSPTPPPPLPPTERENKDDNESSQEDQEETGDIEDPMKSDDEIFIPDVPQEFLFSAKATPLDPQLIKFANWQKRGKGKGRRNRIFSQDRGRYVKPIFRRGNEGKIAGKKHRMKNQVRTKHGGSN
jgi:magnesium chelatase subunit D